MDGLMSSDGAKRAKLTTHTDGVDVALLDEDGEIIDDGEALETFTADLNDALASEDIDTGEMEPCCDGSLWLGDVDPDDVESALRAIGCAVEREDTGQPSGREDDDDFADDDDGDDHDGGDDFGGAIDETE